MPERRVVVTGIGAITPLGPTLAATLDAFSADRSAIARASIFDANGFSCAESAEVRDWDRRPADDPSGAQVNDVPVFADRMLSPGVR